MRILNKFTIPESFSKVRLTSFGVQSIALVSIQELLRLKFFSCDVINDVFATFSKTRNKHNLVKKMELLLKKKKIAFLALLE